MYTLIVIDQTTGDLLRYEASPSVTELKKLYPQLDSQWCQRMKDVPGEITYSDGRVMVYGKYFDCMLYIVEAVLS